MSSFIITAVIVADPRMKKLSMVTCRVYLKLTLLVKFEIRNPSKMYTEMLRTYRFLFPFWRPVVEHELCDVSSTLTRREEILLLSHTTGYKLFQSIMLSHITDNKLFQSIVLSHTSGYKHFQSIMLTHTTGYKLLKSICTATQSVKSFFGREDTPTQPHNGLQLF
jgi:hypothetical protein